MNHAVFEKMTVDGFSKYFPKTTDEINQSREAFTHRYHGLKNMKI